LFNSPSSSICRISVSIVDCPIIKRVLEKYVKQNKRRSANYIGAIYNLQMNPALLGKMRRNHRAYRQSGAHSPCQEQTRLRIFFHFICCASPVSGVKIALPVVLAQR
jgi:hypothetical protein